jgi:hypothetical protein
MPHVLIGNAEVQSANIIVIERAATLTSLSLSETQQDNPEAGHLYGFRISSEELIILTSRGSGQ